MNANGKAEGSTANKLDSTDVVDGFDYNDPDFIAVDMAAIDDERFGRAWALSNLPTYAELQLRDRRFSEARERGRARMAKENWERGDILANLELFADEP